MTPDSSATQFGPARLWSDRHQLLPVPAALQGALAPATHCLFEWNDYWLHCPGADRLRLGEAWQAPLMDGLFRVRFENQLGLALLQPWAGSQPLCAPLHVEVISPKFPTPAAHLAFFRALLHDLCRQAAQLPFVVQAPTQRGVAPGATPATPLFTLFFMCRHLPQLRAALAIIMGAPQRDLHHEAALLPLAEASMLDADVLLDVLKVQDWEQASGFALARRLHGHAPRQVRQPRSAASVDTPENRFVLAFLRELLRVVEALPAQKWWGHVEQTRQALLCRAAGFLRAAIAHPLWSEVGPLRHLPAASPALLRRRGYREMFDLWRIFQHSLRPVFADLHEAIALRDVARLYEIWVFFALAQQIGLALGQKPALGVRHDYGGLGAQSEARFGAAGALVLNRAALSYSTPLRPDFTWLQNGRAQVVLDAKFRLETGRFDQTSPEASAARADLYKMHTYRDALGVRAAVAVYPGERSIFYHLSPASASTEFALRDLLLGDLAGIGALAMMPRID